MIIIAVRVGRDNSVGLHQNGNPGEHDPERQDNNSQRAPRVPDTVLAKRSYAITHRFDTGKSRASARVRFHQQPPQTESARCVRHGGLMTAAGWPPLVSVLAKPSARITAMHARKR